MAKRYWLYSREQLKFKQEREAALGRKFKVGFVIVNGVKKNVTEINSTGVSRFADAKIVAEGDQKDFKYSQPGAY